METPTLNPDTARPAAAMPPPGEPRAASRRFCAEVPGLVTVMQARGVSRMRLAETTGLHQATVWRLMKGKSRAGYEVLRLLCGALEVAEEELTASDPAHKAG